LILKANLTLKSNQMPGAKALHRWDVTPAEARAIQLDLRRRLDLADRLVAEAKKAGAELKKGASSGHLRKKSAKSR
jgi:hypothetical protein